MVHVHVHRPVLCRTCRADMAADQTPIEGWFRCLRCGSPHNGVDAPEPMLGRDTEVGPVIVQVASPAPDSNR